MTRAQITACLALALAASGCGDDEDEDPPPCTAGTLCEDGLACERIGGTGETACFAPVYVEGDVTAPDGSAIGGAEVVALGPDGVPRSAPGLTGDDGHYAIRLPLDRREDGAPLPAQATLRVAAQDYERFPSGVRAVLPIDVAAARAEDDGRLVFRGEVANVTLYPLPPGERARVTGRLEAPEGARAGVLVTLAGAAGPAAAPTGLAGLTDAEGRFTVFNVPPGEYQARAYAAGLQVDPVAVAAGGEVTLRAADRAANRVAGSVQLVAGGCEATSVVLVPRETLPPSTAFPLKVTAFVRGEVPRGLRAPRDPGAPGVDGAFAIEGVPDGSYVALAGHENDDCVADPSNIGGAAEVRGVDLPDGSTAVARELTAFKVTGAVPIAGPGADGAPEAVPDLAPTFRWAAYSSAKNYQVAVFDHTGARIWAGTVCADDETSCGTTSWTYGAPAGGTQTGAPPALAAGGLYQWRVLALGNRNGVSCGFPGLEVGPDRECISTSEDLRGVFVTPWTSR